MSAPWSDDPRVPPVHLGRRRMSRTRDLDHRAGEAFVNIMTSRKTWTWVQWAAVAWQIGFLVLAGVFAVHGLDYGAALGFSLWGVLAYFFAEYAHVKIDLHDQIDKTIRAYDEGHRAGWAACTECRRATDRLAAEHGPELVDFRGDEKIYKPGDRP